MEATLSAADRAKQQLILAAITLFAEHGVDSVPLRMINREAGARNNSALHYHFGSKMGLIKAVNDFIQKAFDEVRDAELALLERDAGTGEATVDQVMRVFTGAYVQIIEGHEWGYAAVRTIARMDFDANVQVHAVLSDSAGASLQRFARILKPLLPELSEPEFRHRYNFLVNSIVLGFAGYRNFHQSYLGNLRVKDLSHLGDFYARMGTRILTD